MGVNVGTFGAGARGTVRLAPCPPFPHMFSWPLSSLPRISHDSFSLSIHCAKLFMLQQLKIIYLGCICKVCFCRSETMVRCYKRKTNRGAYSLETVQQAVNAANEGMALSKASIMFSIPCTTLMRRVKARIAVGIKILGNLWVTLILGD